MRSGRPAAARRARCLTIHSGRARAVNTAAALLDLPNEIVGERLDTRLDALDPDLFDQGQRTAERCNAEVVARALLESARRVDEVARMRRVRVGRIHIGDQAAGGDASRSDSVRVTAKPSREDMGVLAKAGFR
jgi:hypothetical protein